MSHHCDDKCASKHQPPENTLVSLDGENCIACKDEEKLCKKVDLNKYLEGWKYKELCGKFVEPSLESYQGLVNPDALFYTPNPALEVPVGQKGFNMVPDPVTYPVAPHYPPITNPLQLAGKNVLVIGAAKNIGEAIATTLHGLGCNVVGTSRFPECYDREYPYPLLKLDSRFRKEVDEFFDTLFKKYFRNKKLDILIQLQAVQNLGFLYDSNGDDLKDILDNNLCGLQRVVHRALPHMRFSNQTRIISFGSAAGEGILGGAIDGYSISKRAMQMWNDTHMTEALQRKAFGLSTAEPTFTLIEPGFIQSSIGVYENYVYADTKEFSTFTRATRMTDTALQAATTVIIPAVACPSATPLTPPFSDCPCPAIPTLCGNVPQLVADAIVQILRAPQPSVRYLIDANPSAFSAVPFVTASNLLSADAAINQVTQPFARDIFYPRNNVLLSQAIVKDSFCNP